MIDNAFGVWEVAPRCRSIVCGDVIPSRPALDWLALGSGGLAAGARLYCHFRSDLPFLSFHLHYRFLCSGALGWAATTLAIDAGRGSLGLARGLAALGAKLGGHPGARAKHTFEQGRYQ